MEFTRHGNWPLAFRVCSSRSMTIQAIKGIINIHLHAALSVIKFCPLSLKSLFLPLKTLCIQAFPLVVNYHLLIRCITFITIWKVGKEVIPSWRFDIISYQSLQLDCKSKVQCPRHQPTFSKTTTQEGSGYLWERGIGRRAILKGGEMGRAWE